MDLHTDQIIKQYYLKPSDVTETTLLANIIVDVSPQDCDGAFAYLPDLLGYGVVVYSLREDDSWRVTHNYFYLESLHGEFDIGGQRFQWNDGVFSLALSSVKPDGFRDVYFHSLAGIHLFNVSTKILRDRELATRSYHGDDDFKVVANRGEGAQTSSSDLHQPSGVLFLALVNQNALGCWNINKAPRIENFDIVYKDDQNFIYPADIKIYEDDVIVLSNTLPVQVYSRLNYDKVNFRVLIFKVADVVKGTACSPVVRRRIGYH
ncbi:hypothetical protein ILUMI_20163 [Ignelater luminosus]|uniref:Uncharacterized protein n=1 Tax=Ignelater luminosus TaxID=2038154 RepID=A0A8K0CER7_IGNLU|nr:hypothetical protein ILUMI_20163 [Ignelater luminosus]